jgi:hypothetical protein
MREAPEPRTPRPSMNLLVLVRVALNGCGGNINGAKKISAQSRSLFFIPPRRFNNLSTSEYSDYESPHL